MKILVVLGSPHKHGSTNALADEFIRGAREAGNEVQVFDAAHSKVEPCIGCDSCGYAGPCVHADDMENIAKPALLAADMMVLVSPIYYYGFSAQMKAFIDRWYSFTFKLTDRGIKTALITAAWDSDDDVMRNTEAHYEKLCRYMHFSDCDRIQRAMRRPNDFHRRRSTDLTRISSANPTSRSA